MSEETMESCPFCGHPRSRLMHRTEYRENGAGLVACNYRPRITVEDVTIGGDEFETKMLDFRHVFYRRCNKCGARSRAVKTDWHVRTEDEAEDFSIYGSQKEKQWGFDPESEWARPWREAADEAWNRRA